MPRPLKLTSARVRKDILTALAAGHSRYAAAGFAGICEDTLYDGLRDPRFSGFSEECELAEAKAAGRFEGVIEAISADKDHPKRLEAALAWLKKRRREDWGDALSVDVDSEIAALLAELAAGAEAQGARQAPGAGRSAEAGPTRV